MTKLDRLVRANMLGYPMLFPRRIDVLAHLFLVLGNGYEWTRQGTLSDGRRCRRRKRMRYDDLVERAELHRKLGAPPELAGRWAAEIKEERRARQDRAANIDAIASTPDTTSTFDHDGHYEKGNNVLHYAATIGTLFEMPARVEPLFRAGAVEVLDAVRRGETDPAIAAELRKLRDRILAKGGIE